MTRLAYVAASPDASLCASLGEAGYAVETFTDGSALLDAFALTPHESIILGLELTGALTPSELVRAIKSRASSTPILLATRASGSPLGEALEAARLGASREVLQPPFDADMCRDVLRRASKAAPVVRQQRAMRSLIAQRGRVDDLVVHSEALRAVFALAERAAPSRATVLIEGESGTGKERVARFVHDQSDRAHGPFIAVNCAAFAPSVLESELFGHVRGAFTGAVADRPGVFAEANGGTLLLDELGEVDETFQTKLLRVLQEGEVRPVGSSRSVAVDVRVVAATHKNLRAEVDAGRFREDLYYRLAVIPLRVPPLRQRSADILPLARHFLTRFGHALGKALTGWTPEVEAHLLSYAWPGNVRELENLMERACVLARGAQIEAGDLLLMDAPGQDTSTPETLEDALAETTRRCILAALSETGGHRGDAAERLGVERSTLYRLMKKHEL